jgi:tetratricopeptide (TPR) repeat protein
MRRRLMVVGIAAALAGLVGSEIPLAAQVSSSIPRVDLPDDRHYALFRDYYKGEYSRAGRSYRSITPFRDANGLFMDSICYATMQAECHYRLGDLSEAVELQEQCLQLFLDWLAWRDRTQFPPQIAAAGNAWRQAGVTWGTPTRQTQYANLPRTFQFLFGQLDNERVIREGGVVQLPNMQAVDLGEIFRCTALCLYRRNQIKGTLCARDALTNKLVVAFSAAAAGDGHLASAWNGVMLGIAQSSAGRPDAAVETLKSSLQFGGMDHNLTPLALLEMGRASFELGNYGEAAQYFLEATYSAAVFKQYDVIGEGLAGANACHLRARPSDVYAPLIPAITWADREGADALQATLLVELLKNQTELGLGDDAVNTLSLIRKLSSGNDLARTALTVPVNFGSAAVQYASGEIPEGDADLNQALQQWQRFSPRFFQLQLVDQAIKNRRVAPREADLAYTVLLREPTEGDWLNDPAEPICFSMTDHLASLQMWFDILLLERRMEPAFAVADQIRRHQFYSTVPLGGRLMTLRWLMEAPEELLGASSVKQRNELLQRFPQYGQLSKQSAEILASLRGLPVVPMPDTDAEKEQRRLIDELATATSRQEQFLTGLALRREPADLAFARPLPINASEPLLPPRTMLLSFTESSQGVSVISVTERVINLEATVNKRSIVKAVGELLRQIGNSHPKNSLDTSQLKDDVWPADAAALHKLLFPTRTQAYWHEFDEIIVVPDGVLWYAPFELVLADPAATKPLRLRYCPMVSMAIPNALPPPQFPRTLLVGNRSTDAKLQTRFDQQLAALKAAIPNVEVLLSPGKSPTSLLCAGIDRLIGWNDSWKNLPSSVGGFSWIPDGIGKPGHQLLDWHLLPWTAPRQIIIPQFSSDAADGLRSTRANGQELFQLACHALACGSQTLVISRWNVGNNSSFEISANFAASDFATPAIDAWQQAIEKLRQSPIDVGDASRIKGPAEGIGDLKSNHPFFWAGYLLIDTGWNPPVAEPAEAPAQ